MKMVVSKIEVSGLTGIAILKITIPSSSLTDTSNLSSVKASIELIVLIVRTEIAEHIISLPDSAYPA